MFGHRLPREELSTVQSCDLGLIGHEWPKQEEDNVIS